jgi:DNA-binding transcriptional LysR family regulator
MSRNLFDRSGLSLERLRSFLAVADAGAIARAAPRNSVRQSQLSRQIGELEEFFGRALVERRGRGLALTSAGRDLAEVVRRALDGLRDVASVPEGRISLSVGAGDSLLHGWIIPRLAQRIPPAKLGLAFTACASADVVERLDDGRLDLGVARTAEVAATLRSRPLGTIDYALYVPKSLACGTTKELLSSVPLAMQSGDPAFQERLELALRRAGVHVEAALVCETFPQAQRAVATKRYAAVLPTFARAELPAAEFEERRDPILGRHASAVSLVWSKKLERQRPRATAWISEIARSLAL